MQFITPLDYALLPFFIGIVFAIGYNFRNRNYPRHHPWRRYFLPALTVKVFGALFIGLLYAYYYKGGDTFNYFNQSQIINSSFDESPVKWFNLIFRIPSSGNEDYYNYISKLNYYNDPYSYTVTAITAFISSLTLNTYLPTAVLFALISFSGIWALFRTFALIYPQLTRQIAIATLFIPSTFVWGSGIFKDTICIFGLGWLTYGTFQILVKRNFSAKNTLLTILSFYLIAKVKLYILLGFIPALGIWILFNYTQKVKSPGTKFLVKFFSIILIAGGFLFFMQQFGAQSLGKYSLEKLAQTSYVNRGYIYYVSGEEGSAYSLGDFDATIPGMLSKFPLAVNATFFRPYLWEAKKLIVLLSAIEALLFLFITLKIIFTVGIVQSWRTINRDPTIQFCLIFSIIFAFAVGISSYNFGALSRYKIPCLPFYAIALILIYYKNNKPNYSLFRPLRL
jgi:hypothetical protein